ncbi:MAG: Gfo/Idh/MocA family oxidoreductase [Candidatus Brocadiaceae bacterium]|nr:Gfo/Idh/MocA family oxidoreductase [Candidatus Brocadiaceae bacterium]
MATAPGVGVIGIGVFGRLHARVCAESDRLRLAAACSRREASVAPLAERYGVWTTTDYRELVARPDVDIVIVCSPDGLHCRHGVAALEAGKHVFVEKPMAVTVPECDRMIEAAERSDVRLTVGQILRFVPRYAAARERIAAGEIGRIIHMYARRNNTLAAARHTLGTTTPVFRLGSHDLDFMLWCAHCPVVSVYARQVNRLLKPEEGPDCVLSLLTFADGAIAALETSHALPEGSPSVMSALFEAVGTEGSLEIDGAWDGMEIVADGRLQMGSARPVRGRIVGPIVDEIADFARCVREGTPPAVTPEEAREVVRVVCAIHESARSDRPVELPV